METRTHIITDDELSAKERREQELRNRNESREDVVHRAEDKIRDAYDELKSDLRDIGRD